ncbi:MAG: hypothetical protein AABX49_02620, partial [Nanoarchaeota archaeon]
TRQEDTTAILYIDLRGGPSDHGKEAECRYTKIRGNELIDGYSSVLFPDVLDFSINDNNVALGSTRYSREIPNLTISEHTYYIKCKDREGKITGLETVRFNVDIPTSKQISIVRKRPEGIYGKSSVELEVETNGGIDNGAGVRCTFSGIGSPVQGVSTMITPGRYKHNAVADGISNGDYTVNVGCIDRAGVTIRDSWNLKVVEDRIIPDVIQIVSRGENKFITVTEAANCEASLDGTQWSDISKDRETGRRHLIALSGSYYFRCKDLWGNQMNTVKINP